MKKNDFTYGELLELINYCSNQCPEVLVAETLMGVYKTSKDKGKNDDDTLSDIEYMRLRFMGLDELLVDWKRWYGLNKLIL